MDKMEIYEKVRSVPESATKPFSNGRFSGTDINPMWRIKTLTEQFGPCGIGWYYDVVSERCEQHHDTTMAIVDLKLYVKVGDEWSKPIYGTGGNTLVKTAKGGVQTSDEGYKMALTDALSVACKALGIGADVYWDRDKTKYTAGEPQEPQEPRSQPRRQTRKPAEQPPMQQPEPPAEPIPMRPRASDTPGVPDSIPQDFAFRCARCGAALKPYKDKRTGETVGVRQHASLTNKRYGITLCLDCAADEEANRRRQDRIDSASQAMMDGFVGR